MIASSLRVGVASATSGDNANRIPAQRAAARRQCAAGAAGGSQCGTACAAGPCESLVNTPLGRSVRMTKRILLLGVQSSVLDTTRGSSCRCRISSCLPDTGWTMCGRRSPTQTSTTFSWVGSLTWRPGSRWCGRSSSPAIMRRPSISKTISTAPETFVLFVRSVLVGLKDYAPPASPRVPARERHPW